MGRWRKLQETRINSINRTPLTINNEIMEEVEKFQYLGGLVNKQEGSDEDRAQRIRKAKGSFAQLI